MNSEIPSSPVPLSACPWCAKPLGNVAHIERGLNAPKAGDLTVCFYCCTPLTFTGELELRVLSRVELMMLGRTDRTAAERLCQVITHIALERSEALAVRQAREDLLATAEGRQ